MLPTLAEALTPSPTPPPLNGVAPGRLLTLQQGLTIRREICHNSWILRFTGPEACSGGLIDDILDHIERQFQPKEQSHDFVQPPLDIAVPRHHYMK